MTTTCPGCGERATSWFASLLHCDPNEPIDNPEDE